ncbi:hypothetical protein GV791_01795 [Nocardia cyriacigeorgica]|uniref:Uncharacterized protein n=1 Tax=Nocardia cyriacigeorgica TaxID=135487 RepID=A0A6P1CI03_9NOCA|nr:hypothetical protein [Nocardia cyriacigeorgica]MBF6288148.1 hypothetical protein [Nocardia cyriacigeorgica]NEW31293.1 hypothetical protein [Nocardia cyriacigeorgica]
MTSRGDTDNFPQDPAELALDRASQTRNQQEEGPSTMIARPTHPDQPRCVDCGNTVGPWAPTGDRDHDGAQRFRCAPGHGCQATSTDEQPASTMRAAFDALAERALADGATITGDDLARLRYLADAINNQPSDVHGLTCVDCGRLVCVSRWPLPPVTVSCLVCEGIA